MATFQVGGLSHSFTASRSSRRLPHLHGPKRAILHAGYVSGLPQQDMLSSQQQYLASKALCRATVVMMGIRGREFAKDAGIWLGKSYLATNRRFHRILPATAVLK